MYTGNMEADLKAIAPHIIANGIANDRMESDWLVDHMKAIYSNNKTWGQKIARDNAKARDMLWAFMAHWHVAYEKGVR